MEYFTWTSIQKEFKDFLDGKITEISKKPAHKVGPDDLLVDDNNRLTPQGLKIAMNHRLQRGMQNILKSALKTDLVVKTPSEIHKPFKHIMELLQLVDNKNNLTTRGYYKALTCLPLKKQCEALNITFETIFRPKRNKSVEIDVFNYYYSKGWRGAFDEGETFKLILHGLCLDKLTELASAHAEHRIQVNAQHEVSGIISKAEPRFTALKKLIEAKNKGKYDFTDIYSEWKIAEDEGIKNSTNINAWNNRTYARDKFISEIKERTGVKDDSFLNDMMSVICKIEEKNRMSSVTTSTEEELEEELTREQRSLETSIENVPLFESSWGNSIFYWLKNSFSLSYAFPPGDSEKVDEETKKNLLNTIKITPKSKLMDNIILARERRDYDAHHDPNAPRYISLEFIEKVYSHIGVSKILKIAEEYFDGRLGLNGWPDLTLIKGGQITLIEVKAGIDKLHYNQVRTLDALRNIFKSLKVLKVHRASG